MERTMHAAAVPGLLWTVATLSVVPAVRAGCDLHEQQKVVVPGTEGDELGYAVAVSGDLLVAGARFSDTAAPSSGSARVFRHDGNAYVAEEELVADDAVVGELAGWDVAVDGPVVIMGAPFDQHAGSASGAAYVFRHGGGGPWVQEAKLVADDAGPDARFGNAVAVSGDVAVVGAFLEGPGGSAYVFRFGGSSWIQEAKLTASDGGAQDRFGVSVAVSGSVVVVGAQLNDSVAAAAGAAYVFRDDGASWVEEAKLIASDGAAGDWLGASVAIDGEVIVAGAPRDSFGTHLQHGSAYLFAYEPGPGAWFEQAKLNALDATEGDQFGGSVSLSGRRIAVGARYNAVTAPAGGAAYLFVDEGQGPVQQARLTAADGAGDDQLGFSVAAGVDVVVAGAPFDDDGADPSGAAYVFETGATCVNLCPADLNGDGLVDTVDLLQLLGAWGPCAPPGPCPADLDGSGAADVGDLLAMLGAWGICP